MKIAVDRVRCEGHGLCVSQAPEVFDLDDEDDLVLRFEGADVPREHEQAATRAVLTCPVAALREE